MTMKRPLPPSSSSSGCAATSALAATLLLLILPSATQAQGDTILAEGARKKPNFEEECVPLLSKAVKFDDDGSGGLDRNEFASLWKGLDQSNGSTSSNNEVADPAIMLPESVEYMYDMLLCSCHEIFGHDWSCCDDTGSDDDDNDNGKDDPSKGGEERWTEVKLVGFDKYPTEGGEGGKGPQAQALPNKSEKDYHKEFCKEVFDVMRHEGVEFVADDPTVSSTATTTKATAAATTTTTTTTTTTEAPTTTEEASTTTAAPTTEEAAKTTTPAAIEPAATTTPEPETTEEATTVSPAATEAAVTTTAEPETTTTSTTTTSTTTTTTTTTTTSTTSTTEEEEEESIPPITLRFLGSTDGQVDADSFDMDQVTFAFWTVALDVLDDMNIITRRGLRLAGDNAIAHEQGQQRQLVLDNFVEDIYVYFESVVMDVKDVGCPDGLVYAIEGSDCLRFKYTLTPLAGGPLTAQLARKFTDGVNGFYSAVNVDGKFYEALIEEYPDTAIVGMGSPGDGIQLVTDNTSSSSSQGTADDTQQAGAAVPQEASTEDTILLGAQGADTKAVSAAGFPIGGIIGGALAAAILALLLLAFVFSPKRRRNKRMKKEDELNDSNLSEDIEAEEVNDDANAVEVWLDEVHDDDGDEESNSSVKRSMQNSPGSSLAAMGVASTVATRLSTGETEVFVTEKQPWTKNEPVV